jgi:hypothetical protein
MRPSGRKDVAMHQGHYVFAQLMQTMSRALLKMRSGRCGIYNTSSCCFVKHLFVRVV